MVAADDALRRTRRQRVLLAGVGLALAAVVGIALVARAGNDGESASSTTSTSAASTSSTASTTTTTLGSAAGKPCVAAPSTVPPKTPAVPVPVGPPPKQLVKLDLKVGKGALVKPHATVTVNYVGVACSTGKIFTSTFGAQPYAGSLDGLVPGLARGTAGMKVGGERLVGIPPALAYGSRSPDGSGLAPNESLWFVVQAQKTQ